VSLIVAAVMQRRLLLCVPLLLSAIAPRARADGRDKCLGPYGEGQELRREGRLRAAREVFRTCARDACPPAVRVDCAQWGTEVSSAVPTVIVRAKDERGQDVAGVRVLVDGDPVASYEDGRPFELDPGAHSVRVEAGLRATDVQIVAREGEKARTISVTLRDLTHAEPTRAEPTRAEPMPEARARPVPPLVWVFGAIGVAALGSFATFGLLGFEKHASLRESCAPRCTSAEEAPVRVDYAIGDVSLAVSIVSLGVATWLFLTRPDAPRPSPSSASAF
jgi:hypothetical protein